MQVEGISYLQVLESNLAQEKIVRFSKSHSFIIIEEPKSFHYFLLGISLPHFCCHHLQELLKINSPTSILVNVSNHLLDLLQFHETNCEYRTQSAEISYILVCICSEQWVKNPSYSFITFPKHYFMINDNCNKHLQGRMWFGSSTQHLQIKKE